MITPKDIQEKVFTKTVRGYKEDEVNAFLDDITIDMDKMIQENAKLHDTIASLKEEIGRYQGAEGSIYDTLEAAKALMSDISASAEKKAEIVLKNAELDADRITKEARDSVARLNEEAETLTSRWNQFKTRYKNLLENELERFEGLSTDFLIEHDFPDIPTFSQTNSESNKAPEIVFTDTGNSKTIKTTKRKASDDGSSDS